MLKFCIVGAGRESFHWHRQSYEHGRAPQAPLCRNWTLPATKIHIRVFFQYFFIYDTHPWNYFACNWKLSNFWIMIWQRHQRPRNSERGTKVIEKCDKCILNQRTIKYVVLCLQNPGKYFKTISCGAESPTQISTNVKFVYLQLRSLTKTKFLKHHLVFAQKKSSH